MCHQLPEEPWVLYIVVPTVSQVLCCRIWASKRFTNSAGAEKLQELHMASWLQVIIVFDCETENRFPFCIGLCESHCPLSSLHLPVSGQSQS